jgi:hypothetical protein
MPQRHFIAAGGRHVAGRANAEKVRMEGEGEAARIRLTGLANAEKIRAVGLCAGGGLWRPAVQLNAQVLQRFAEAIEHAKLPLAPQIMVSGGHGSGSAGGSLVEMLLTMLVADKARTGDDKSDGKAPDGSGARPFAVGQDHPGDRQQFLMGVGF